jgi:hypothetical protein
MNNHIFQNHCVDFEEILSPSNWTKGKCLDRMLKSAHDQSRTEEAKLRVDFANYKDYGQDQWCPIYFGMFTEWLAWHFFNHYGRLFNVEGCEMLASEGSSEQDLGTDGRMQSIKRQPMSKTFRIAEKGSPVYLQVKGTMNKTKVYAANDGSRLPNFCTNAMSDAIRTGQAYKARYIVFTTGEDIHYTLDSMSNGMLEIVSYKDIKACLDMDWVFLNRLRSNVGLTEVVMGPCDIDPESAIIRAELEAQSVA